MTKMVNIQTVTVPNPDAMKFAVDGVQLCEQGIQYQSLVEAAPSPLAKKLFAFEYVTQVFISQNFITISRKEDGPDWNEIMHDLRIIIKRHIETGQPVFNTPPDFGKVPVFKDDLTRELNNMLVHGIMPATHDDGGEISFESFEDGVLKVKLAGACVGCPFASRTIKHGVEVLAKRHFGDAVKEVTSDDVDWTETEEKESPGFDREQK